MAYTTLDKIVRSALLRKRYPMHYYVDFLKAAADCLRELRYSILDSVETKVIAVNDYNAIDLPCDYVQWVRVGYMNGGLTYPLVQQDNINRLRKSDGSGGYENYDTPTVGMYGSYSTYTTEWGTFNGGFFGYGNGYSVDTFKEVKERNQIQINQGLAITDVYLEYISDGSCCSTITKINPLAQACIEAYIMWQQKEQNRTVGLGERQIAQEAYKDKWRELRARLDPMTTEDVKRIWNNNYMSVPNR